MTPPFITRLTAAVGLFGVVVLTLAILVSSATYSGSAGERYSPLNHFVSELGETGISPNAAVFNLGLIIGGICMAISTVGVALTFPKPARSYLMAAGLISGISGTLVGFFPMDNFPAHIATAFLFFMSGWFVVVLFSVYIYRSGIFPRRLAFLGVPVFLSFQVTLALASLTPLELLAYPGRGRPPMLWPVTIFEWLAIILVLVWISALSISAWLKH